MHIISFCPPSFQKTVCRSESLKSSLWSLGASKLPEGGFCNKKTPSHSASGSLCVILASFGNLYGVVWCVVFYFTFGLKQQRILCMFAAGDKPDGSSEVTMLNSLVLNDMFLEFLFSSRYYHSLVWVSGQETARGHKTKLHYTFLLGTGHFLSFHLHPRGGFFCYQNGKLPLHTAFSCYNCMSLWSLIQAGIQARKCRQNYIILRQIRLNTVKWNAVISGTLLAQIALRLQPPVPACSTNVVLIYPFWFIS